MYAGIARKRPLVRKVDDKQNGSKQPAKKGLANSNNNNNITGNTNENTDTSINKKIGTYQQQEVIGRGGFGVVHRGQNTTNAETVAIKQVYQMNIPHNELESIELEIKQMQGLDHPNIVKYKDAIRSESHLNIILEFVENGSLSSQQQKIGGTFPENLVAVYIAQVVLGLEYLHSQGVIHRDIKGANIQSTKEGTVKQADFGVATKLNESRKSDSVAGTPYWMAPEIIEMTGQLGSSCDIWSVGCTIIEQITGKPPYYDMQQMAALFRIVQDDHPPLPDDISPSLVEFLLECFQKDPNRRIDAAGLLRHKWLRNHVQEHENKIELNLSLQDGIKRDTHKIKKDVTTDTSNIIFNDDDDSTWDDELLESDDKKIENKKDILYNNSTKVDISSNGSDDDPFDDISDSDNMNTAITTSTETTAIITNNNNNNNEIKDIKLEETQNPQQNQNKFAEDDKEPLFNDIDMIKGQDRQSLDEENKKVWDTQYGGEQNDDIFDAIDLDDKQDDTTVILTKFDKLLSQQTLQGTVDDIILTCEKLAYLIKENTIVLESAVASRGVIPIIEMLESTNHKIILVIQRLINIVIDKNIKFQQNLSLVGQIPTLIKFSTPSYNLQIRTEVAYFLYKYCNTNDFTRKMFVACGCIPIIINFQYSDWKVSEELILLSIDCIHNIFNITTSPRNDFLRLFCKFGLQLPWTQVFLTIHLSILQKDINDIKKDINILSKDISYNISIQDQRYILYDDTNNNNLYKQNINYNYDEYIEKMAQVLEWTSNGDAIVKKHFANIQVQRIQIKMLPSQPQNPQLHQLKSLRAIAMDPSTLDVLEKVGAIPAQTPFLDTYYVENQTQVQQIMYYQCSIKQSRQEQAVQFGIIPYLMKFISSQHPQKQFAYPIVFSLCKTSSYTRNEMKKHNGVLFLLDQQNNPYWKVQALDSLTYWLMEDKDKVEYILCNVTNANKLLHTFQNTNNITIFELMLPTWRKFLSLSSKLCNILCNNLIPEIILQINQNKKNNGIRVKLLQIQQVILLSNIIQNIKIIQDTNGFETLCGQASDNTSPLVSSLAVHILSLCRRGPSSPVARELL